MKGKPLPSELEGKGVFGISGISSSDLLFSALNWNTKNTTTTTKQACLLGFEPTSVLDSTRSPSPPTSSSTSLGGGAGTIGMISVAAAAESRREDLGSELQPLPYAVDLGGASEKWGMGMENWVNILSDTAAAGQDQSSFRCIMGDVEDTPNMGYSRLLQTSAAGGGGGALDFDYSAGFGAVDQELGLEAVASVSAGNMVGTNVSPDLNFLATSRVPNPMFSPLLSHNLDEKPPVFNPHCLLNQHQNQIQSLQNQAFFSSQQEQQQHHHLLLSPPLPPLKRQNSVGGSNAPFCMLPKQQPMLDSGQELYLRRPREQEIHGFSPHRLLRHRKMSSSGGNEEMVCQQHHLQQTVIDQLYEAAEMVETGNLQLAQGILARLNHQLSPVGKPFLRAAFYFKEALQLLLDMNSNSNTATYPPNQSPFKHIYRIGAYKSYSEISPILQFANFTCIQALLEALDGFNRIHIVDFNIGYGGQWASFMQELSLRNSGPGTSLSLKITVFVSAALHDELELSLIHQNLTHFAHEINMSFELEILSLESLNSSSWSLSFLVSENEAIAVNLPVGSAVNYSLSLPVVLQSVKQLSPKIVVSLDRGNDRPDLTFPQHIIYALHSHWTLLDSLDAMNVNLDAQQKIERFLLQPEIEKTVLGRYQCYEKNPPWRTLFQSSGFSPMTISNFNESQAECLLKRTSVLGFHVEKRQSSLVLFWQQKELISASAWRC